MGRHDSRFYRLILGRTLWVAGIAAIGWVMLVSDVGPDRLPSEIPPATDNYQLFIPYVSLEFDWVAATLHNAGFEADWSEESSHRCLIFETDGSVQATERGNIFTPPGWTVWYKHGMPVAHDPLNTVGWSQPEVRDARSREPDRVHSGEKGLLFFTFWRVHDGGLVRQVDVEPGTRLRLSAWAHAWSNQDDDPWTSVGADGPFFALEGSTTDEALCNFTFRVGIDPAGGMDPYAETVVWGPGAHIYNVYAPVPPVEAVAQADSVTLFLRSRTLWAYKHNDAYWDDVMLEAAYCPSDLCGW